MLEGAAYAILPRNVVSTAWPSFRETSASVGILYDPWQQELNKAILAKESSGLYAADTVLLSIPRQSGKTYDIGWLAFADAIVTPNTTIVWTAHRFKVARETFTFMCSLARQPEMQPHLDYHDITTGAGNEVIPFRNGSRIVFAARERGTVRGYSKVRRLVLDECQILPEHTMSDLAPTLNQASNPQIVLIGTPPKANDPGEVMERLRGEALSGRGRKLLYVEYSADPNADPDDPVQRNRANPSHGNRTPPEAVDRLRSLLTTEDFMREAMGVWAPTGAKQVFGEEAWEACSSPESSGLEMSAFGIALSRHLNGGALVGAGTDAEGNVVVKPLRVSDGTGWTVRSAQELQEKHGALAVVDSKGPAAVLIPQLESADIDLRVTTTTEKLDACSEFYSLVRERRLRHSDYPELDMSVQGAIQRKVGERWAWGSKDSAADISALEAATLAAWGVAHGEVTPKVSAYADHGLMVV